MDTPSRSSRFISLLACAGFASALVTIGAEYTIEAAAPNQLSRSLIRELFVGGMFGAFITAAFAAHNRFRSVLRGVVFIASSSAAYLAAMSAAMSGLFLFPYQTSMNASPQQIPLPVFLVGGCAGAFLVLGAARVLFGTMNFSTRTIRDLLIGTVAGGLLGVAGWAFGPLVGRPLLLATHAMGLRPPGSTFENDLIQQLPNYFSLYVLWQAGMGAVIGFVVTDEPVIASERASSQVPTASRRLRWRGTAVAGVFITALLWYLGLQLFRVVRAERKSAHGMEEYRKVQAEAPSVQHLPSLSPRGWDETLVLEDIGGLFVKRPTSMPGQDPTSVVLKTLQYSVAYVPHKDAPFGTYQPMVRVFVDQYPNAEWAQYRAKYPSMFNPALDDPKVLTTVSKFGQRIVMNTMMRSRDGEGALYFLWPSGNLVVLISYEMREVNEDFIKRYLQLLPSSL